jgi:hypothetical protein
MAMTKQQKDALIAYRMMKNYLDELAPQIHEYVRNACELSELEGRPQRRQPAPQPETPEERASLIALLAEVQNPKEKK